MRDSAAQENQARQVISEMEHCKQKAERARGIVQEFFGLPVDTDASEFGVDWRVKSPTGQVVCQFWLSWHRDGRLQSFRVPSHPDLEFAVRKFWDSD